MFNLYGVEGSTNVQGERVKKLDVIANEAFITALSRSTTVSVMVSEENENIICVKESQGDYICVFDPLDGSSNIDANVSIGSIYGIYRRDKDLTDEKAVLKPGTELVAAGYTLYGSATVLVLGMQGEKPNGFTLDPSTGEFVLTHASVSMPESHPIYSINEGNTRSWDTHVKKYVQELKEGPKSYSLRYVGSMVADVHRTLTYGGIFLYPEDSKSGAGKLRLLYEANPLALLIEGAGGKAITGRGNRILEIVPTSPHQRTGVVLGSKGEVEKYETYLKDK